MEDDEGKKPSTRELIDWRDKSHTNVSIYALDPFYKTFMASPAPRKNGETVRLCFICKDNHCYPILNQDLISKITNGSSLIKHLDLIQWNSQQSEEKTIRCKTIKEYHKIIDRQENIADKHLLFKNVSVKNEKDYKDYLIVLSDGFNCKDTMMDTMGRSETYIEYFHYNGRNQIDGFVTPDLKNMVTKNNDYDLRKNICDQLYKKYPVEAFTFNNKGLTSIAVNLFKQIYGYIPKSDYNRYVTTIMDEYYPKALQHTSYTDPTSEFELTAFDIAKDYPSVLLTNKHNIPIYNIHNTIEKFDGKLKNR